MTLRKTSRATVGNQPQRGGVLSAESIHAKRAAARKAGADEVIAKVRGKHSAAPKSDLTAARDAKARADLAVVRALGLYAPTGDALTPARRRAIRKAARLAEELAQGAAFAPVGTLPKAARLEAAKAAKSIGARITKRGIFLPRAEREMRQAVGKLSKSRQTGMWEITVEKTFVGPQGEKRTITEIRPLAGLDALEAAEDRLNGAFGKIKLRPDQRIRFAIHGQNVSRRGFRNMQDLLAYAKDYRKGERAQATFLGSLMIVIYEKDDNGNFRRPVAFVNNKKRVVQGNADDLSDIFRLGTVAKPIKRRYSRIVKNTRSKLK